MDDFRIGYEEKTSSCHITGAHRFSEGEIGTFLNHFEKKHNCSIPHKDLMLKLAGNQLLSSAEEDDIKATVGTDVFQKFIEYVNTFRAKKYEHSMRPQCLIIAEKLRKIAAKITNNPCNQPHIEELLESASGVRKISNPDAPRPIKITDIPKAIEENNLNNHQKAEYAVFKEIKTWRGIDDFEIKYNSTTGRLFFGSNKKDWYMMVDGSEPEKIEKVAGTRGDSYFLTCKNGDQHIFRTVPCEFGSELKYEFIGGEAA